MRFGTLALAALLAASCAPPPADPPKLNVVVLFADDQRSDTIHAWGNEAIRTPSLDRLVDEGFSFRNAHVMGGHHGAICAPSRAMLMSGRQLFRVYDNLDSVATFPERFAAQGYRTFATGKWHSSQKSFGRTFQEAREVFFGGMSDHEAVPVRDKLTDSTFTEPVSKGFSTDIFAEALLTYLRQRASDREPFVAYAAFTAPHDPRQPKPPYGDEYAGGRVPLPGNFMPLHPFDTGDMQVRDEQLAAWPRDPETITEQLGEYYGLITHLDDRIGDVLALLDSTGLAENTIVVYAADNGLALGSHGLLGKQSLYEHSNRVPLIIRGPGIAHGESDALALLHDIAPTLHELTGTQGNDGMDGLSLAPILRGDTPRVRTEMYTAYRDLVRAVTEERYKLVRWPKLGIEQLFDLAEDSLEMVNLVENPEFAPELVRLRGLMEAEHTRFLDPAPLVVDSLWSADFDWRALRRSPDRWQPAWIVEKYFGE